MKIDNEIHPYQDLESLTGQTAHSTACCSSRVVENAQTIAGIFCGCSFLTLAVIGSPVTVPLLAGGATGTLIFCIGPSAIPLGMGVGIVTGVFASPPLADIFWWNHHVRNTSLYVAGALFAASMAILSVTACSNLNKRDYNKIEDVADVANN